MNNYIDENQKIKSRYVKIGLTVFLSGLALIICYLSFTHFDVVKAGFAKVNKILMPFYIGIIMAYLLTPIYNLITKYFYKWIKGKFKTSQKALKLAKVISTVLTIALLFGIIVGLVMMVVPGTIDSVMTLIPKVEPAFNSAVDWIDANLVKNPDIVALAQGKFDDLSSDLINIIQTKFIPTAETIVSGAYAAAAGAVSTFINFIIAIIICIYILNSKEVFSAQARKWVLAIFKPEKAAGWFELAELSDEAFGGFINGKIIDSAIIGVICAICMAILKMPLIALISVIVGITNIIPFFGPFIGGIPSVLLLMIMDPVKALEFAVLIVAIQQFDGNILGPAILGKATKLSAFWVLFAILVAGGFFGFLGMILGVPVFAILYTYIARAINNGLKNKNLSTDEKTYESFHSFGIDKKEIYPDSDDFFDHVEKAEEGEEVVLFEKKDKKWF